MNGIIIGLLLVIVDIISFALLNMVYLQRISNLYLLPIMFLYSTELILLLWGLLTNFMASLNVIWTVLSIIGITVTGVLFFKEPISASQTLAFIFAAISILLFLYANQSKNIITPV
jgi:hypothetical protein